MGDLVTRAREFATIAHQRIDHQRKYSKQPYHVHLEAVAELVASVSDDEEMIAAAWLHDTVEDTPATLDDIEEHFGESVAQLVEELSDISKPSDGNRAQRKAIDRMHSARASARAKTVKLADLIDNCMDIVRHDERFARIYLVEMGALLEVLTEGDPTLLVKARALHEQYARKLGVATAIQSEAELWEPNRNFLHGFDNRTTRRMFMEIFTARDIAEGLLSFDAMTPCDQVVRDLEDQCRAVASVRVNGMVRGYVRAVDLGKGKCTDFMRNFTVDQIVDSTSTFTDVIHVLTRYDYCFVTMLGNVAGIISRDDINKPMVRMWLFGIVTMIEMTLVSLIHERFPEGKWERHLSAGRLQKAREIQKERQRRNLYCDLVDCLQLPDKALILVEDPVAMERLGMRSKRAAKRVIKELESLRNHLAHAQDIVRHDWPQIARLSMRIEEIS